MLVNEDYVRISDLAIVSHVHIQKTEHRYRSVPFDADDLLAMGYAKLNEPANKGYRATGYAEKIGNTYFREYVDQSPEESLRQKRSELAATDEKMSRFAEDLYDCLINKGVIVAEDLPEAARNIIIDRKAKRGAL